MDINLLIDRLKTAINDVINLHADLINALSKQTNKSRDFNKVVEYINTYKINHYYEDVDYSDILDELLGFVSKLERFLKVE